MIYIYIYIIFDYFILYNVKRKQTVKFEKDTAQQWKSNWGFMTDSLYGVIYINFNIFIISILLCHII